MQYFFIIFGMAAIVSLIMVTVVATGVAQLGFPLPLADRRLGAIDGLRGYLALSVMLHHFFVWVSVTRLGSSWAPPPHNFINQMGAGGVALFFMTTGLVFYPRVLAGLRATSWPAVYVARFFRIVPLVAVSFALVTIFVGFRAGFQFDRSYVAAAAKWISAYREATIFGNSDSGRINAYVLWSLRYEWMFYLIVLPICACAMDIVRAWNAATWVVPVGLLAFAFASRALVSQMHLTTVFPIYLPLFAIGMLAYECQSRESVRLFLSGPLMAIGAVGALLLGMIVANDPYYLSLPLFCFFFVCVACGNSLGGLLRTRGALVLGECSFAIYLLHGIVLYVIFIDGGRLTDMMDLAALPVLLPIALLAIIFVAPVTYLLVERPAIKVGKALVRRFTRRPVRFQSHELEVAP